MELSRKSSDRAGRRFDVGRCRHFFWLGVLFDTVGVAVLFTGVFVDVYFYDMLLYLGSIIIFFSLLWWISWYTGNIELHPDDASRKNSPLPSRSVMDYLGHNFSQRLSRTLGSISHSLVHIRPRRRRHLRRATSQNVTVTSQMEEDKGEDPEKSDAQDYEEAPGPEPVEHKSSERVGSLGPEAGGATPLEPPEFAVPPLDLRLPPSVLQSKSLPVVSAHQPVCTPAARSQIVLSLASASQTAVTPASGRASVVTRSSQSHLLVPVASLSQPLVSEASQSLLLLPLEAVATQTHPLVPAASQSQPQETPTSSVQTLTQVSAMQPVSDQSFQTVGPQACQSIPDLQAEFHIYQLSQISSLVQESSRSQTSSVPTIPEMPAAQTFESLPLSSEKLKQELPVTPSPDPKAAGPATEAVKSGPTDSAPALAAAIKKS